MSEPVEPREHAARSRARWAVALAVTASLLFALSVPALWLNRVVFDTETWVATVAPLAQDPAIQDAVATAASEAIIEQLDVTQRLTDLLPGELERYAPVLGSSVENAIRTQATRIVRSDRFAEIWTGINRRSHEALLVALTGREGAVGIQAGTITLDTGDLIEVVSAELEERGLGFVSRVPSTGALDRQVVLYQSDALASAGPVLESVQRSAMAIPLAAVVMAALAFALAADRRRVALWLGAATTVAALLPLQFLYLAQYATARTVERMSAIPSEAARSAFDIIFRDLVAADQALGVVALLVWFGAVLAGPARWAVALRSGVSGGISGVAARVDRGSLGAWVAVRKRGLRIAAYVIAAVVLLIMPPPRTLTEVVWFAVGVVLGIVALEFLGAEPGGRRIEDGVPSEQARGGTAGPDGHESGDEG